MLRRLVSRLNLNRSAQVVLPADIHDKSSQAEPTAREKLRLANFELENGNLDTAIQLAMEAAPELIREDQNVLAAECHQVASLACRRRASGSGETVQQWSRRALLHDQERLLQLARAQDVSNDDIRELLDKIYNQGSQIPLVEVGRYLRRLENVLALASRNTLAGRAYALRLRAHMRATVRRALVAFRKFKIVDGTNASLLACVLLAWWLLSDFGTSWLRLLLSVGSIAAIYAVLFWRVDLVATPNTISFTEGLLVSLASLTGTQIPLGIHLNRVGEFVSIAETLTGFLFAGLAAAAIVRSLGAPNR